MSQFSDLTKTPLLTWPFDLGGWGVVVGVEGELVYIPGENDVLRTVCGPPGRPGTNRVRSRVFTDHSVWL